MNEAVKPIETIEEVVAYQDEKNPWVTLYFDRVRFPNGATGFYNRIVESNGKPGVAILPLWEKTIGLLRQYRYPVRSVLLEIPRGFGEIGVPEEDAIRELEEETGMVVGVRDLKALGVVHPNSGLLDSEVHLFAARCSQPPKKSVPGREGNESLQWLRISEVAWAIENGGITDSFTIAAVARAMLRGILPSTNSQTIIDDRQQAPK